MFALCFLHPPPLGAAHWVSISRALGDCGNLENKYRGTHTARHVGDGQWTVNGRSRPIAFKVTLPHSEKNKTDMKVFVTSKDFGFMK